MRVWIASWPRSGNTLVRLLLRHLYAVPTPSVYDGLDKTECRLAGMLDELSAVAGETSFAKTHDFPRESDDSSAIYVVRDGRDAAVSYANYLRDGLGGPVDPGATVGELLEQIIAGDPFGGWSAHVTAWTTRRAGRTVVIRYEQLVQQPVEIIANAMVALGVDLHLRADAQLPSFAALHERWPVFFRRGKTGGWREVMTPRLHALFRARHGDAMRRLGYIDA